MVTMSQHSTAQHSTAQHSTAQHSTAQHSTAQHSTAQHSTAQHSTAQHSTAQHSTAQHSTAQSTAQSNEVLFISPFFICCSHKPYRSRSAEPYKKIRTRTRPSAGLRLAPFSTIGDINEKLSSGIGLNFYYEHPLSLLLQGLPSYAPDSLQAMFNYESLSGEEKRRQRTISYSLSRVGLELGPFWSFVLAPKQNLSLGFLVGFAQENASRESEGIPSESDKESALALSTHFLLNYEYHYSDYIFGGGLYTVYGPDKDLPLLGVGLNLGVGYKF